MAALYVNHNSWKDTPRVRSSSYAIVFKKSGISSDSTLNLPKGIDCPSPSVARKCMMFSSALIEQPGNASKWDLFCD